MCFSCPLPVGKLLAQVRIFALHHAVYSIGATLLFQVVLLARDDVCMNMGHALACVYAVLYGDVQGRGTEDSLHHAGHPLHGQK